MGFKTKFILVTFIFAVPAFLGGHILWLSVSGPSWLNFLHSAAAYLISIVIALAFGLGIAFMIFGWSFFRKTTLLSKKQSLAAYLSIIWLLVSWWPHNTLHLDLGEDLINGKIGGSVRLLYGEYGYHFLHIVAAVILAYTIYALLKPRS